jgi:hypothetical protein
MYDYRDEFSSWEQLANVANQALGFNYTESFYRKPCQEFYKMLSIYIDRIENGKEIKKLNDDKQNLVSKISILETDYKNLKEQLINTEKTLEKLEVKSELSKINVVKQRTKQLEINKIVSEGIKPVEITDGYNAGWLAPDGTFYGLNGTIANMLHNQIADA